MKARQIKGQSDKQKDSQTNKRTARQTKGQSDKQNDS